MSPQMFLGPVMKLPAWSGRGYFFAPAQDQSNIVSEHNGPASDQAARTLTAPESRTVGDLLIVFQGYYPSGFTGVMNVRTPTLANWGTDGATVKLVASDTILGIYPRLATADSEDNCLLGFSDGWDPQWGVMLRFSGNPYAGAMTNWRISADEADDVADPNMVRVGVVNTGWSDSILLFISQKTATETENDIIATSAGGDVVFGGSTNTNHNSGDKSLIGAWGFSFQESPSAEADGDFVIASSGTSRVDSISARGKSDDSA